MQTITLEPTVSPVSAPVVRLLLLEHCQEDADSSLRALRDAGIPVDPTITAQRSEFEAALSSHDFAAVFSAYSLPGWTGLDALQLLRRAGNDIPFILVTGVLSEDAAAEFVKQGLNDYVLKDRLARLPVALKRALEYKHFRDADAQVHSQLAESEARGCELIDNSTYGIFCISLTGSFLYANPALLQPLACPAFGNLQSLNFASDIFRYPENFLWLLSSCREHDLVHSAETEWRRKDGGLVTVRLHLRYLSLPGPADAIEGFAEDVTELRRLELQLRQVQKFEIIGQWPVALPTTSTSLSAQFSVGPNSAMSKVNSIPPLPIALSTFPSKPTSPPPLRKSSSLSPVARPFSLAPTALIPPSRTSPVSSTRSSTRTSKSKPSPPPFSPSKPIPPKSNRC